MNHAVFLESKWKNLKINGEGRWGDGQIATFILGPKIFVIHFNVTLLKDAAIVISVRLVKFFLNFPEKAPTFAVP
ncbi:MAG: hypothetical protein ABI378_05010 [Chitinophagaceae bacterium]